MHLGLHVVNFTWPDSPRSIAPTLGAIAEATEDVGLSHLSLMDHYFQLTIGDLKPEMEMLEGYTTLGFLAAKTKKVPLGLLVTGVSYRHPGLLAKIITTLDVLSGGRAELGIGAAWYEREHKALGVPFAPVRERLERLEETLQICLQMWGDNNGPFEGKHYQLAETINVPSPIRRPRILIGGGGEKVLLRLVARYADACNLFSMLGVQGVKGKLDILRRHCDDEKRDYDAIRKTLLWVSSAYADDFVTKAAEFAKIGITEIMVMPPLGSDPVAWVRGLEPTVRRLAEIG
jgi:F420-dependent oxidoreductase-like protein